MITNDYTRELDSLAEEITTNYSTELGERYIALLEEFLQVDSEGFGSWLSDLAGRRDEQ
jgi:hypothetical protein